MNKKNEIYNKVKLFLKCQLSILFSFRSKIFILAHPTHPNLGDQAQLMCTEQWLKDNYPNYQIIKLGSFTETLNLHHPFPLLFHSISFIITYCILKLKVSKKDIFIGHSGYFMIDHHRGWKMFVDIIKFFPHNKLIIFPQTINFHTPYVKKYVSYHFSQTRNVTLLCRDQISYKKAHELFPNTKLLLFPDIVTSLIGSKQYTKDRDGVLFCFRNDLEARHSDVELDTLVQKFENIRQERIDTTLQITESYMAKYRNKLIWDMIDKFASFKVIITDRYHGTIFSAIASTPVVVINSTDHKLSSGVKWFPKEFVEYIHFADSLDEAFNISQAILNKPDLSYNLPTYFNEEFYKKLKKELI